MHENSLKVHALDHEMDQSSVTFLKTHSHILSQCGHGFGELVFSNRGILSCIHVGKQQHWQAIPLDASGTQYSVLRLHG